MMDRRKFFKVLGVGVAASAVPVVAVAVAATKEPLRLPRFKPGDLVRCSDFNNAFAEIEKQVNS
jgi:hypothetical protein